MTLGQKHQLTFRPRARIIRTIGDQLISGPEAAVIELVKNSYDADASYVSIVFEPPLLAGFGRIVVTDDGHGMSASDVTEKWMEPATSSKVTGRRSRGGRTMLGSKGIGRFAAAKLGQRMTLTSVCREGRERRKSQILDLDWSWFEDDRYLSEIVIDFEEGPTSESTGTVIEIGGLREAWSKEKMERLVAELRRLVSPLSASATDKPFRIFLDLSRCTDRSCGFEGSELLGAPATAPEDIHGLPDNAVEIAPFPLLASSDYEVEGYFDPQGNFHGSMEIRRGGQNSLKAELKVPLREGEVSCGRVDVHFSIFDREADVIRDTMKRAGLGDITAAKARQILDETAGVAIYRDGFRVRPYGSPEHDWLALDSRRVQDPSLRIGHNQIAGFVTVESQSGSHLVERSSREGFEDNAAFRRLRRLIIQLFAEVVEPRRQNFRAGARLSRQRRTPFEQLDELSELKGMRRILTDLPAAKRASAEKAISEETAKIQQQIEELKERQRVLEAKSSLGLIVGEILHEGAPEANFLAVSSSRLLAAWKLLFLTGPKSDEARDDYPERLRLMAESGGRLRSLFVNLRPLSGGRRTSPQSFNVMNVIKDTASFFDTHNVEFEMHGAGQLTELFGHKEDLATALLNLISNAIFWLENSQTSEPKIRIRVTWVGSDEVAITIQDNGPGVPEEFAERIFDLKFTLKESGTGLGLNIAQEALARSGGRLLFHPEFPEGAKFEIRFPRYKGEGAVSLIATRLRSTQLSFDDASVRP